MSDFLLRGFFCMSNRKKKTCSELNSLSSRKGIIYSEIETMENWLSRPAYHDYYLVLDFEATCWDSKRERSRKPQEIIEFAVVKVDARTLKTESEFQQYVRPTVHPHLSSFCTELTGISQEMLAGKPDLQTTMKMFDTWMRDEGLLDWGVTFCFVTLGSWDLKRMLPGQCSYFRIHCPSYFNKWIDIQNVYHSLTGKGMSVGLFRMLNELGLKPIGRHHSGIDDAHNTAQILKKLSRDICHIEYTGSL